VPDPATKGQEDQIRSALSKWEWIMGRAILAISGSAIAYIPRPFAAMSNVFAAFWHELTRDAVRTYRPERHYMRGPGPAWRAKHSRPSA